MEDTERETAVKGMDCSVGGFIELTYDPLHRPAAERLGLVMFSRSVLEDGVRPLSRKHWTLNQVLNIVSGGCLWPG